MNAYANAGHQAAAYKNQQVTNAGPEQLTLMLYSGAARFVAENIKAVEEGRRVCAVGTTTMRALETSVSSNKKISAYRGWTNKFIYPPHDFGVANAMITNFHTPKSTLIMMIAAFANKDFIMRAYEEAIKEKYKFYSYGDAMLIL